MSGRRLLFLLLILAAVLALVVYSRPDPEGFTPETSAQTESPVEAKSNLPMSADPESEPRIRVRGASRTDARAAAAATTGPKSVSPYPLAEDVSIGRWMENYGESMRDATPEDFEQKQQQANELDGEAAYWLHEFYKFCDDQPRSEWQLDYALSRVENRVERAARDHGRERRLNRAQETLDQYEQGFRLCSFLGPEFDAKAAALAWLETAADLGHMGALRLYHSQARQLLTEDDSTLGFQQPDLIHMFKSNARKYARQLLETGHPQGYFLMARMYYVGDVFDQDYHLAYAYAYAGFLAGTVGSQYDAQMWMRVIAQYLPPTDIPAAEKMARELLDQD